LSCSWSSPFGRIGAFDGFSRSFQFPLLYVVFNTIPAKTPSRPRTAAGARFAAGVVLYDGETVVAFADDLFAVPIYALWEPGGRAR
jgi:hypothetical protein